MPFGLSLQSSNSCDQGILYRLIGHKGITLICDVRSGCTIGQPVIIQSTLIIDGRVSDIFVIEIKELATFQSVKCDSSLLPSRQAAKRSRCGCDLSWFCSPHDCASYMSRASAMGPVSGHRSSRSDLLGYLNLMSG